MRRTIKAPVAALVAATAALAFSTVAGHASSLATAAKSLGAAGQAVPACDTDGLAVVQNYTLLVVTGITVSTIAAACAGETLYLTVNNGSANASASGTVPTGGGSMTVTMPALPVVSATDGDQIDLVIR